MRTRSLLVATLCTALWGADAIAQSQPDAPLEKAAETPASNDGKVAEERAIPGDGAATEEPASEDGVSMPATVDEDVVAAPAPELIAAAPEAASAAPEASIAAPAESSTNAEHGGPESVAQVFQPSQYSPMAEKSWNGMYFAVPLHLSGFVEQNTAFGLDRYSGESESPASLQPLLRIGAKFSTLEKFGSFQIRAEYEHDVVAGPSTLRQAMDNEGRLSDGEISSQLRKAYAVASFDERIWLGGGAMASTWGLGLVANAGEQRWQPGTARFSGQRGGDRVLRAFAAVGLQRSHGIGLTIAADKVLGDDVLLTDSDRLRGDNDGVVEDDTANQFVGALRYGEGKKTSGGIYAAYRDQSSVDGAGLNVVAVDLNAKTQFQLGSSSVELEGEVALINGSTTWASTMDYEEHDVRQVGAAVRAAYHHPRDFGGVADFLYASGDQNFDDGKQTGFRADRNYEMGMLLFRQVLAGQTARAVATASDLELVGEPAPDIERFATRGSASNTVAFFPRAYYRPLEGLEIYGGPLMAFTAVKYADPLNSRLAGGTPRNALNGTPGNYLGTELDVGVRYRRVVSETELTIGVEGGLLMPGSVFDDADGNGLGNVFGARAVMDFRL